MSKPHYAFLSPDGEWGEFFWRETHDKKTHAATFAAVTSFGVYGYSWGNMGMPFAQFAAKIGEDYLCGKIATMVDDIPATVANIIEQLETARLEEVLPPRSAGMFISRVRRAASEWGDAAFEEIRRMPIPDSAICWDDLPLRTWESDALQFARKLWPAFVEHLQSHP